MQNLEIAAEKFSVLERVPIGICVLREDFVVLFWNRCMEDWTHLPSSEIVGTHLCDYFPHLSQVEYASRLQQIFAGGPPTIFSSQLHKHLIPAPLPNGQLRIQHTTVTAIPASDEPAGFYAILSIQDVTELTQRVQDYRTMRDQALAEVKERLRVEEELAQYRNHLEELVEERTAALFKANEQLRLLESVVVNANDTIVVTEAELISSPSPRILYVNEAFTHQTGYTPEEVLGKSPRILQGPKTDRAQLDKIRAALLNWEPIRTELINYRKDGSEFWVELNIVPIANECGWYTHWVSLQRDITERKAAEQALRESERRFHAVFNNTFQLSGLLRPDGTFVVANRAALDFFGLTQEEIVGLPFWEVPCWAFFQEIQETVKAAIAEAALGKFIRHEFTLPNAWGNLTTFDFSLKPIFDETGAVILLIPEARDISKRKQEEQALQSLVSGTASVTGEDFFPVLVQHLVLALGVRHAVVAQKRGSQLQTLAFWSNDQLLPNTTFEIIGNPCQRTLEQGIYCCAAGIQQLFPENHLLKTFNIESYLGVSLIDSSGQVIGSLFILDHIKLTNEPQSEAILRIFAARAAAELERQQAIKALQQFAAELEMRVEERTAELKQLNQQLRKQLAAIEAAGDGIAIVNPNGEFSYLNNAHVTMFGYESAIELVGRHWKVLYELEEMSRLEQVIFPILLQTGQWHGEAIAKKRDGTTFFEELSLTSIEGGGLICVCRDITKRKQDLEALRDSEERFRQFADNIIQVFWMTDSGKSQNLYLSLAYERIWGRSRESIYAQPLSYLDAVHPEDRDRIMTNLKTAPLGEFDHEYRIVRPDGEERWIRDRAFPIRNEHGEVYRIAGIAEDITQRRQADERLKASLEEKEVLLREIHHRVKNNLQVISSLLQLQSRYTKDPQTLSILKESQNRVKSMALIHEKLYQSEDLSRIDFNDYIHNLAKNLLYSYSIDFNTVKLNIDVEQVTLNLETAIPCGLFINELVSNALKHAFPQGRQGQICIKFHQTDDDQFLLVVNDNGIGLPEHINLTNNQTLGLRLVNTWANQLQGSLELDRSHGTTFKLKFLELHYTPRI
ncbi:PAS domain S-box protein [Scytonema sp. UIC 10036]|uniref:PAS domain S-box protein n=1 Tax=Scytonema sp. UIC 10036 TaxID=2304196 RepID=UPI0012DAE8E4|nr:PAS domain S-box protein [Scytonema sp. UIC 10036]MUG94066.1 PAS domain S-box protein [Scytonema sp. UIC 10036]